MPRPSYSVAEVVEIRDASELITDERNRFDKSSNVYTEQKRWVLSDDEYTCWLPQSLGLKTAIHLFSHRPGHKWHCCRLILQAISSKPAERPFCWRSRIRFLF